MGIKDRHVRFGLRTDRRRLSTHLNAQVPPAARRRQYELFELAQPHGCEAAGLRAPLIIDAEVVHLSADGVPDFDALHSRMADEKAVALAFDLLLSGKDIRRQPLIERKTALKWVLRKAREGIQYVEHAEGHGNKLFAAVCILGLERIVSKRLTSVYRSGPSKTWIRVKNPKSPAATRAMDGTF